MALGISGGTSTWKATSGKGTTGGSSSYGPFRPEYGGFKPHPEYTPEYRQATSYLSQQTPPYNAGTAPYHFAAENQWIGDQGQNLQAEHGFGQRDLDQRFAELGIDKGANARDRTYYDKLLQVLGERRNIVGETFNNQLQGFQNKAATDVRNINTEATAGGSWFAPRRVTNIGDVFKGYEVDKTGADLSRRGALQGLFEQQLGYERSRDQTGDSDAKLDIMAKRYGIQREQLDQNLKHGMDQLGYSKFINLEDLFNKLAVGGAPAEAAEKILGDAFKIGQVQMGGAMGDDYMRYMSGRP